MCVDCQGRIHSVEAFSMPGRLVVGRLGGFELDRWPETGDCGAQITVL